MTKKYQSITGMNDILPDEVPSWRQLEETARAVFELYGFSEIRLPLLEQTELFVRGVGETTEVVTKEMYSFTDKGGDPVTLRPEGTAGAVRACLQHSLSAEDSVTKLYYMGPMFRYERPQKGRLRQFHQIGAETLGVDSPLADAEMVIMLDRLFKKLGVDQYVVQVNSLGTREERKKYLHTLEGYFQSLADKLCSDCQGRLKKNPLRIMDCKVESCQTFIQEAPVILGELTDGTKNEFNLFKQYLDGAQVVFEVNPRLARGLDYYEKTTFEFVSQHLGSQNAFVGGGRYNHLVHELGGPQTPAVGFSIGCERVILLMNQAAQTDAPQKMQGVYLAALDAGCFEKCRELLVLLRDKGVKAEMDYQVKSLKSQLRRANKLHFHFAAIVGTDELARNEVTLKNLQTGAQSAVRFEGIASAVGGVN